MFWSARAHPKPLAEWLRRMSIALGAGVDLRKTLASETRRVPATFKPHIESISADVNRGVSLSEAISATGDFFPLIVRQLMAVGEETGQLPGVLKQLAEHYEEQQSMRRVFLSGIAWPMIQLGAALLIIGVLIAVSGWVQGRTGQPFDPLGWGLSGTSGLIIYILFVTAAIAGVVYVYRSAVAGRLWTAGLQRAALRMPGVGSPLRTIIVARFAWTLHLAMNSTMSVKQALTLALSATRNVEFTRHLDSILAAIDEGREIHDALRDTDVFPIEFIQAVQVGEESGSLVETMAIVSRQYYEQARLSLVVLARIAAFLIWCAVAGFIVMLIFRLYGFYLGNLPR